MEFNEKNVTEFMNATAARLDDYDKKFRELTTLEPLLDFLSKNFDFLKITVVTLDNRLAMLKTSVKSGLPAMIQQHSQQATTNLAQEVTRLTQEALQPQLDGLRDLVDQFRRDTSALYATKQDVELARISPAGPSSSGSATKTKTPLPEAFSGKKEDWKVFANHILLYLMSNEDAYPLDSDKVKFTCQLLGKGAAFKYMMEHLKKLKGPVALRPALVTNFELFMATMQKNFGVQNANAVAEAQLLQLRQTGPAIDYTNKFVELTTDLGWNDPPLIAHYRRGLKDEVIKAMDALPQVPTDFTEYTEKAMYFDNQQWSTHLDLQSRPTPPHTLRPPSNIKTPLRTAPPTTPRPPSTPAFPPSVPDSTSSSAMDLSTATRHITPEEKQQRFDNKLCLYCGGSGHLIGKCPNNRKTLAGIDVIEASSDFGHVSFSLNE